MEPPDDRSRARGAPLTSCSDVAVIGGGPAGAAAAIALAGAGRTVDLFDRARFPRDKCCGDGLTTGALRILEHLGLDPATVASWETVSTCVVRSPSGRTIHLALDHEPGRGGAYAAVARRTDLDAALLDVARAAGVKVHDGHAVVGATGAGDEVRLEVEGVGPVVARYAVAADGAWSPMRKLVGASTATDTDANNAYLGDWHALRQYVTNVTGPAAAELWVSFEPDLLPGYFWSFPLPGGGANVGFGVMRGSVRFPGPLGKAMKELWPDLLSRSHILEALGPGAVAEAPHKAWPIPARLGSAPVDALGGRVLFAGDAARACDPMTGEGIGQALQNGIDAAAAIIRAGAKRPTIAAARYRESLRGMQADHALARFLSHHALAHRKGARAAVRIAGSSAWVRRNFARWLFEDYERAILATPNRWRRGMFTGPPAFAGRPSSELSGEQLF